MLPQTAVLYCKAAFHTEGVFWVRHPASFWVLIVFYPEAIGYWFMVKQMFW